MSLSSLLTWLITLAAVCSLLALPVQAAAKLMFKWKPPFFWTQGALLAGNVMAMILDANVLLGLLKLGVGLPVWMRGLISMLVGVMVAGGVLAYSPEFKEERASGFLKGVASVLVGAVLPVLVLYAGSQVWQSYFH